MTTEQFTNASSSTLVGAITNVATTLVVASATSFPTLPQFRIIVDSEIMIVTAISGTTFTVTRGQEGTTASSHANSVAVVHIITAGAIAGIRGDWQVGYDVDFGTVGAITPQSFSADTTYTIDGKTWTVVNHGQCTFSIDSLGLFWHNITGTGSYDVNPPTRTSCIIQAVITQFIPNFEMDWGLRLTVWNSVNPCVSQYQRVAATIDDGTTNQIYGYVKGHRQDNGLVTHESFTGVLGSGPSPYFLNDTTNTGDDVFMIEAPKIGSRFSQTYTGTYSSGWPANTAMRKRADMTSSTSGVISINMLTPSTVAVLFTASDNVSPTGTYSPRIRRMRLEYKL